MTWTQAWSARPLPRPPGPAPRERAAPVRPGGRSRKVYVVTAPASIRGIYETWDACRAAVSGVAGARYQGVADRAIAEAMLSGDGLRLEPGAYAFVDGNAMGGIGVVLVDQGEGGPVSVRERAATVYEVFGRAGIPSLDTRSKITAATDSLQNIIAELGALYAALGDAAPGSALTVVHDYEGVGAWLEGRWKAKNPIVADVVAACRALIEGRGLRVRFRHQRGHESTFAGRNDFAAFNARADKLATEAALRSA
jgi:Caulimovirus viroplasmin